jgi:hypothetical protein
MREAVLQLVRDLTLDLRDRRFSVPSVTYKEEAIFIAMPPGPPTSRGKFLDSEEGIRNSRDWLVSMGALSRGGKWGGVLLRRSRCLDGWMA